MPTRSYQKRWNEGSNWFGTGIIREQRNYPEVVRYIWRNGELQYAQHDATLSNAHIFFEFGRDVFPRRDHKIHCRP